MGWTTVFVTGMLLVVTTLPGATSNIDPDHRFAWGESIGWTNWHHETPNPGDGVLISDSFLAGYVWADNVGWINLGDGLPTDGIHYTNLDGSEFGVNIDLGSRDLFGLAWGENVGWINFDTAIMGNDRARFDECDHRFVGYAWGENIGWINLNNATHFVAIGPCVSGDLNCDGEVALDDFAAFTSSLSGPDTITTCSAFDVDDDSDVDLVDYSEMQRIFMTSP